MACDPYRYLDKRVSPAGQELLESDLKFVSELKFLFCSLSLYNFLKALEVWMFIVIDKENT
jgi:hypothetical protein